MKVTPRFTIRAALAVVVAGAIGAMGACSKDSTPPIIPPPPPPPLAAPTNLTATAASSTTINLTWAETDTSETGFQIDRCSGAGCSNFAQLFITAANAVAYSDAGLAASTSYTYRVKAVNATQSSDWSTTTTALTLAVTPPAASPIFVGAGEITSCSSGPGPNGTAALIQGMLSDTNVTVFSAGEALADPAAPDFSCFDSKWGSFKNRTIFALGTGDFQGRGADAAYAYYGDRTGPKGKGYFSFDKGNWHIVVLNTTTYELGAPELTEIGSTFNQWLINDLTANTKPCVMAISWERRLYTSGSGSQGQQGNMNTISTTLYNFGVDILVSANDHRYERFPQTNTDGKADAHGFRQFVVGTGGMTTWSITPSNPSAPVPPGPSSVEAQGNAWGVIKFTLDPTSYKWEFVPVTPGGFTDSGTTNCN
jgi:hypothetical protein